MNDNSEVDVPEIECAYYETQQLNDLLVENHLVILQQNIRSYNRNFDSFSLLLNEISKQIDVIVLTETWFTESLCGNIEGYESYHVYRSDKSGGGVSVYVRCGLQSRKLPELTFISDICEICTIEVMPNPKQRSNNIMISGIYRAPNAPMAPFLNHLINMLPIYSNKSAIIAGDLNIDLLEIDQNVDYANTFYSYNFYPLINVATRVTENTAKCLDHIWYNRFNVSFSGSIMSDITDHYPVLAVLETANVNNLVTRTFRDHSDKQLTALRDNVILMCNDYFVSCADRSVDEKCSWLLNRLSGLYCRHCPKKTKNIAMTKLLKPWITNNIKQMANYKHYLFKQYKNNNATFTTYNTYKNNLNRLLKKAKKEYYNKKFNDCKKNNKKTWKIINSILSKKIKKNENITLQDGEGREVDGPVDVANAFCEYFATIATRLDADIPVTVTDPMSYMPEPVPENFIPSPATEEEVVNIISSFQNKSCHINSIPIFIFKKLSPYLAPVLCEIFNDAITQGIFPSTLKIARIVPIHKGKSNKIANNFRPISLLPLVSKIIEKLMKTRAMEFITKNNILYNNQFGFRPGCSTSDAVLQFADDCVTALDKKQFTIAIFLDFSKAFDTVNKDIMIRKLQRLGFRGTINKFFLDYLTDRKMYVDVRGSYSVTKTTNIGLPQGSVSSPWLFSLYINDMHRATNKLNVTHFADDTTVYMSGDNLTVLCEEVCEELNKIDDWLKANRLSLNIDKTNFMIVTHKKYDLTDCIIKIRDTPIKHVKSTKFLGMTIDDKFSYNDHITILSKQLSKVKGLLYKLSETLPVPIIRQLYFSYFYSRIVYCISVWGGGGITNIDKISKINKAALKLCVRDLQPSAPQPFQYYNIYKLKCLGDFHKYANNNSFKNLHTKIHKLIPDHVHCTRFAAQNSYSLPIITKTVSQNQFLYNALKLWNNLPTELKNIQSTTVFKSKLKLHLRL